MPGINVIRHYALKVVKDDEKDRVKKVIVKRSLPRVRLRKTLNSKTNDSEQIEDCSIAEEFEMNEEPIYKELERREMENVYKASGLGNSFLSAYNNPLLINSQIDKSYHESFLIKSNEHSMEIIDLVNKDVHNKPIMSSIKGNKSSKFNLLDKNATLSENVSIKNMNGRKLYKITSSNVIMRSDGKKVPVITKIVRQKVQIHRNSCKTSQCDY